jgi:hypothetical protein
MYFLLQDNNQLIIKSVKGNGLTILGSKLTN